MTCTSTTRTAFMPQHTAFSPSPSSQRADQSHANNAMLPLTQVTPVTPAPVSHTATTSLSQLHQPHQPRQPRAKSKHRASQPHKQQHCNPDSDFRHSQPLQTPQPQPPPQAHVATASPPEETQSEAKPNVTHDEEQKRMAAVHVTIWHRIECRKIAGNAAPLRRNLQRYLQRHPECEEYVGQDKNPNFTNAVEVDPITGLARQPQNEHVPIWNCLESRKVTGNAAPLRKNLSAYLAKHPECEVYSGQDKQPNARRPWPPPHAGAHGSSVATNTPGASSTVAPSFSVAGVPLAGQGSNSESVRFVNADGKLVAWGPPVTYLTQSPHANAHQNPHLLTTTPTVDLPDLTYNEIVSSWSHIPDWAGPHASSTGRSPHMLSGLAASPMDVSGEASGKGIPIPGGRGRGRDVNGDVSMAISMGSSFGGGMTPVDVSGYLAFSPKRMEMDSEGDFHPNRFMCGDSQDQRQDGRGVGVGLSDGVQVASMSPDAWQTPNSALDRHL